MLQYITTLFVSFPVYVDCFLLLNCFREFRNLVIDMVLATDMSYHFQQIKNMKNLLSMPEK